MKKTVCVILFVFCYLFMKAQHYEVLYAIDLWDNPNLVEFCSSDENFLGVIIYGIGEDCPDERWWLFDNFGTIINGENADSIVIDNPHEYHMYELRLLGCDNMVVIEHLIYFNILPENPFLEQIVWKRPMESIILEADGEWSTGEIGETIEVSEPGTYSVTLTNDCGSATYSVEVRDNVEIYRATTDLVSNLNQVTWNTTPEQSEYITAVKVYRNNELVGTVPYTDGVFTDNMGSENTQWQYHIVGVSVEGDDCPIPSYWKRTIHLDRVLGAQGQYILQWTPYEEESPEKDEVTAYGIYDVVNGIPNHVIDVGYFTNVYAYNPADFHGYGAVAAVFAEKGLEEFAFSNLTKELLTSVGENPIAKMSIYPNPANGEFTVDGPQTLTIFNTMGQVVATSYAENGVHTISLSSAGVYFVKSDEGIVRKVVVK